jgi:hypothetical protein
VRSSRGGSLLGLLFIIFLVLKLTGVIDWSWWWVTSPLWLPAVLVLGGLLLAVVLGLTVYKTVTHVFRRRAGQIGAGGWRGRAKAEWGTQTDSEAQSVVVEAAGSEVTVVQTERTEAPRTEARALPSAGSTAEIAESQPGPERP